MADQIMRRPVPLPRVPPKRKVRIRLDPHTRQWEANHGVFYALGSTPVRALKHLKNYVAKESPGYEHSSAN